MLTVFAHEDGQHAFGGSGRIPPGSSPTAASVVWVDLVAPTPDEAADPARPFQFHELAVEDALQLDHHPKVESYDGYLYLILHGIDFQAAQHRFATHDIDFFLGPNYLVTVHDGTSRSVDRVREVCATQRPGPRRRAAAAPAPHRGRDGRPLPAGGGRARRSARRAREATCSSVRGETLMRADPRPQARHLVAAPRDHCRSATSWRRLARREFPSIGDALAYRFRDVYDHLARLTDEAIDLPGSHRRRFSTRTCRTCRTG